MSKEISGHPELYQDQEISVQELYASKPPSNSSHTWQKSVEVRKCSRKNLQRIARESSLRTILDICLAQLQGVKLYPASGILF